MALNELYEDMWCYIENQLSHGPLRDTLLVFRSEVAQLEAKNDKLLALFKEGGPLYILRATPELPSGVVGDISLDNACSYLADYIAWFQQHREWIFDTIEKVHQVIGDER